MKLFSVLLISSSFLLFPLHAMDPRDPNFGIKKNSPRIQFSEGSGDTLEKVLGAGDGVLLKMSMNLTILKELPFEFNKEKKSIPARLFLTDLMHNSTGHPSIDVHFEVNCEPTTATCVLSDKPKSFDSYVQFSDWLKQGYLKSSVNVSYDFNVNVRELVPSLAKRLFALPLYGYHFIGTHTIDNNSLVKPDQYVPSVTYTSKRGTLNATTVTLGGTLYLKDQPYPIDDHDQVFPHPIISQEEFKGNQSRKLYHPQWLAQSEVTLISTYEEFPKNEIELWPGAPFKSYRLLRQKPADIRRISHTACSDGTTGEEVDISDGKIFFMHTENITKKESEFMESIVTNEEGKPFIVRYLSPNETSDLGSLQEEAERLTIAVAAKREMTKAEMEKAAEAVKKEIGNLKEQLETSKKIAESTWNYEMIATIRFIELLESKPSYKSLLETLEGIDCFYDKVIGYEPDETQQTTKVCTTEFGQITNSLRSSIRSAIYSYLPDLEEKVENKKVSYADYGYGKLKSNVIQPMKDMVHAQLLNYRLLQGHDHPIWEEFGKRLSEK